MYPVAPSTSLLPPLSLLLLSWASVGAGDQGVQVEAPAHVRGFLGTNVTLPCHLKVLTPQMNVQQVTWWRSRDPHGSVATFHHTKGSSISEPKRMEFVAARTGTQLWDGSLMVWSLNASDEDNYTCEFVTFPEGHRNARTWLQVLARPQNQAEALRVQFSLKPVPVARCTSSRGRPPARISWHSLVNGKTTTKTSQVPGPLHGTSTVTSLLLSVPSSQLDGQNVTCRVEHDSLEKPDNLPVTLTVHYPPEVSISCADDNFYIGRNNVTLNCDARCNPGPTSYRWKTVTGALPPSAVALGPQLLIRNVNELVNTTFICNVSNAVGTGQAQFSVFVTDIPPGEKSDPVMSHRKIILLVGILLASLGFLIFFLMYKKECRNRNWNLQSRAPLQIILSPPEDCSPEDLQTEGTVDSIRA